MIRKALRVNHVNHWGDKCRRVCGDALKQWFKPADSHLHMSVEKRDCGSGRCCEAAEA